MSAETLAKYNQLAHIQPSFTSWGHNRLDPAINVHSSSLHRRAVVGDVEHDERGWYNLEMEFCVVSGYQGRNSFLQSIIDRFMTSGSHFVSVSTTLFALCTNLSRETSAPKCSNAFALNSLALLLPRFLLVKAQLS